MTPINQPIIPPITHAFVFGKIKKTKYIEGRFANIWEEFKYSRKRSPISCFNIYDTLYKYIFSHVR